MNLLVDGHNLIGQMPHLSLADADDEARLVLLLRRYTTAKRGRRVVVVFDRGVYGHPDRLDGYGVTCVFARSPQDADAQLAQRLRSIDRPREWAVVTSDRAVARAAQERGVRVIDSRDFAARLVAGERGRRRTAPAETRERPPSQAEVEEWLRLFGVAPDEPGEPG